MDEDILREVEAYYTEKVKSFGSTPKGVDWNGVDSQFLRFKQLLKILPKTKNNFSILDYGCGYGALLDYLNKQHEDFQYTGFDISEEMIQEARKLSYGPMAQWTSKEELLKPYDFVAASGIFNVRQNTSDERWLQYIIETLKRIDQLSTGGFSFNILTKYSDEEYKKAYLYYADPAMLFDYCKTNFSKSVALLHDYELYEFTILVRKQMSYEKRKSFWEPAI